MAATSGTSATETFVERFAAGWAGGAEGFFERFLPLMDEDVVLRQPPLPAARGHAGFRAFFEPLFAAIPDLRGEVLSWAPEPDGATVVLELRGTVDGLPLRFVSRDRLVLRDGRALSRHARLELRPILRVAARRPRFAWRLLVAPLLRRRRAE